MPLVPARRKWTIGRAIAWSGACPPRAPRVHGWAWAGWCTEHMPLTVCPPMLGPPCGRG